MEKRELPKGWDKDIPTFPADAKGLAGPRDSGKVLNAIAKNVTWVVGGAADLNPSTKTFLKVEGAGTFTARDPGGREHPLRRSRTRHGRGHERHDAVEAPRLRSGFMIFSDYARPAIRLSALMHIPPLYIFTHDSIGVGEDGPTHQPIEHLDVVAGDARARSAPARRRQRGRRGLPLHHELRHEPVVLALTRQALPTFDRSKYAPRRVWRRAATSSATAGGTPR